MLNYFNNIANIFQVAPALTGTTYNFTPQNHQINRKAPASPPKPQGQAESDQEGHPARVKTKGAAGEPKRNGDWLNQ